MGWFMLPSRDVGQSVGAFGGVAPVNEQKKILNLKNFRENKSFFNQTCQPFNTLGAPGSSLHREITLSSVIRARGHRCSDVDRAGVDNT
jgi:hypothetical protein